MVEPKSLDERPGACEAGMDFRVLGPVRFEIGEEVVNVGPQVTLFVVLMLVSEHQQIRIRDFADLTGKPTKNVSYSIRQFVRALGKTPLEEMLYKPSHGGRGLAVPASAIDYVRFRELVARAGSESGGDRIDYLRAAVGECEGEPLEGLLTPGAERIREKLVNECRGVRTDLVESLIKAREFDAASQEAARALDVWPRDEMFMRFRVCLLRRVAGEHQARDEYQAWISSCGGSGPDFDSFVAEAAEGFSDQGYMQAVVRRPSPSQLPNCRSSLVGRETHYAELDRVLLPDDAGRPQLATVTGMPGVGKSALAINWAYANESAFDAIFYENLGGFSDGKPMSAHSVLSRFLEELGIPPEQPDLSTAVSMYRSAMAERRILVVIDNARNADHARPLLPGRGSSAAIVTSRDSLAGLVSYEGARQVAVKPFDVEEAGKLLRQDIGGPLNQQDPYIKQIAEFCGGLPLALVIVAAIATAMPELTVRDLAKQLCDERNRLDALGLPDPELNLRAVFEYSHRSLSPGARRLLERMAIHPGPTIGMDALTALNGHETRATKQAVAELRGTSLLDAELPGRLRLHDVTRDFAFTVADERDPAEVGRVRLDALEYLLQSAAACDEKLDKDRLLPIDRGDYQYAFMPIDVKRAMAWFSDEHSTLLAAIRCAEQAGLDRYVWLLPLILVTYQWRTHRYAELQPLLESAAAAAHEVAGSAQEATIHRMIAGTMRNLDQLPLARYHLGTALELARSADDLLGIARTQHLLASYHLENQQPDLDSAEQCLTEALAAFRELGNEVGGAGACAGLSSIWFARGEYAKSEQLCDEAWRAYRLQEDRSGEANMSRQHGRIKAVQGDLACAEADLSRAERIYRVIGYDHRAADVLVELAEVLADRGRVEEARAALAQADSIYSAVQAEAKIQRVAAARQRLA